VLFVKMERVSEARGEAGLGWAAAVVVVSSRLPHGETTTDDPRTSRHAASVGPKPKPGNLSVVEGTMGMMHYKHRDPKTEAMSSQRNTEIDSLRK
jgi:hypothetical protein